MNNKPKKQTCLDWRSSELKVQYDFVCLWCSSWTICCLYCDWKEIPFKTSVSISFQVLMFQFLEFHNSRQVLYHCLWQKSTSTMYLSFCWKCWQLHHEHQMYHMYNVHCTMYTVRLTDYTSCHTAVYWYSVLQYNYTKPVLYGLHCYVVVLC